MLNTMLKMVCLFKRKPGMSREAFKEYYETKHVPLVLECFPTLARYSRSYVDPDAMVDAGHLGARLLLPDFDVMTECWFEDRAGLEGCMAVCNDPVLAPKITADEENFFDRSAMMTFITEEHFTPDEDLPFHKHRVAGGEETDGGKPLKMVCLLKRKPGMSLDAFKEYYETRHAPLAVGLFPAFARYTRSYIDPDGLCRLGHIEARPPLPDFDEITEIWYANHKEFEAQFLAARGDPTIGERIAADEENLFDRPKITMFLADEHVTPAANLSLHNRPRNG